MGLFSKVAPKPAAKPVAAKPVAAKPVAAKPVAAKPVMGNNIGKIMPGIKPLPPGSIGMPGGPGGKTVYNTGPMPVKRAPYLNELGGIDSGKFSSGIIAGAPVQGPVGNASSAFGTPAGNIASRFTGGAFGTPVSSGMKKGGKVSSASKRADGIAQRGKTRA